MRGLVVLSLLFVLSCGAKTGIRTPGPQDFVLNARGIPLVDGWYYSIRQDERDLENQTRDRLIQGQHQLATVRIRAVDAANGAYEFTEPHPCCFVRQPDGSSRPSIAHQPEPPAGLRLTIDEAGVGILEPGTFYAALRMFGAGEFDTVLEGRFEFEGDRFRGYYIQRFRVTDPRAVDAGIHFGTKRWDLEFVRFDRNAP